MLPYLIVLFALTLNARASVLYIFTYTASSGPFPSTTFQLVEPGLLGVGSYSIPAVNMSDGSVTYSFTHLTVGTFGGTAFCFEFGTATASVGDCTASIDPALAPNAFIGSQFSGSAPPSSEGTFFGSAAVAAFPSTSSSAEIGNGEFLQIDVSPEPATAPVAGAFLLIGAAVFKRVRRVKSGVGY